MRTSIRLLIFATIVVAIFLTLAPHAESQRLATSAVNAVIRPDAVLTQLTTPPAAPVAPDLVGTWTGTLTPDAPDESADQGMIVVRREGETLRVTAGPSAEQQFAAEKVASSPGTLAFELSLPGDTVRIMQFDLRINDRQMTGKVTMMRDGQSRTGVLAFEKR
jgi:hypothetical protein